MPRARSADGENGHRGYSVSRTCNIVHRNHPTLTGASSPAGNLNLVSLRIPTEQTMVP